MEQYDKIYIPGQDGHKSFVSITPVIIVTAEELRECFMWGMESCRDTQTPDKSFDDFLQSFPNENGGHHPNKNHTMSPSQYIEWIDKEMESAAFVVNAQTYTPEAKTQAANKHFILRQAKEKFLTIDFTSQATESEQKNFTDGLE